MSGAPGWVAYAALALSASSLGVSVLTYRAGNPRLRVTAIRRRHMDGSLSPTGRVTVISGRAATTVEQILVLQHGNRYALTMLPDDLDGPSLSCPIAAHTTRIWEMDLVGVARAFDELIRSGQMPPGSAHPSYFYFAVVAGNGKWSVASQAFDAQALIAEDASQS